MSTNQFILAPAEYKRDINILNHYVRDSATYLQIMTGKTIEECTAFIKQSLKPGGRHEFVDPKVGICI